MQWSDEGVVLSARRHGESAVILSLLTREHGRHAGLVRGGAGRRQRGVLQPGNMVSVTWRARLEDHLGAFTVEPLASASAQWLDDPGRLAALSAACAVVDMTLPEREPCPHIVNHLCAFLEALPEAEWAAAYVRWELALLGDLGFGLDLSVCAATGRNDDLAYVSPKSGRAVSLAAGEPYRDRLLPLPGFLTGAAPPTPAAVWAGMRLTGFFLDRHLFQPQGRSLPDARDRLAGRIERQGERAGTDSD
jgi:DNA repair protein RecO (recombination protein O)